MSEWIVNAEIDNEYAVANGYKRLVRCNDCRFRNTMDCGMQFWEVDDDGYLYMSDDWTDDDGFCSWGERKDKNV